MYRKGLVHDNNTMDVIDDLDYQYMPYSNRLATVNDFSDRDEGFKDGLNAINNINDYLYDTNGNMISDLNKEISLITYNHLNLPTRIELSQGIIEYFYTASGVKQHKKVTEGNNVTETFYAGGFVYTKTQATTVLEDFDFYFTPEGYAKKENGILSYVYQYKDHLGNVRLSYKDNNGVLEIIEENNYYPFGSKHEGYNPVVSSGGNSTAQKYRYNGKEWQDELGLNLYDYHARLYDPTIGKMLQIDPNAYKYGKLTPFNYAFNNPVLVTDPDGKDGIVSGSGTKKDPYKIKANYYYYGLDKNQKEGFLAAINSFNNNGNAHKIEDANGNKIYAVFELNAEEAADEASAVALADNDIITITDGENSANLRFGNTVSNGDAEDSNHLGNANSNHINLDSNATKSFFDSPNPNTRISYLYKGTSIHEIGHNLGGNHNDPGKIMSFSTRNYNTGSGINQKQGTVFSSPSVSSDGIQAILGRMVTVGQVLGNSRAGYNTIPSRYFGPKQNANITEGSVGRLVYNPD